MSMEKLTLIYGMRLLESEELAAVEHAQLLMENGQTRQVTMHTIEGLARADSPATS